VQVTPVILDILLTSNVNVVTVPPHVLAAVKRYATFSLSLVAPSLVASAYQSVQTSLGLHWESKMRLLRYASRLLCLRAAGLGRAAGAPGYTHTHTHTRLMALCPGLPG